MLDEAGEVLEEGRLRTTEGGVWEAFRGYGANSNRDGSGTHSIWISEQLKEYGHEVIVANVTELHAISHQQ
jgi:transposase